jgi:Uma2 family endonuclease
MSFPEKCPMATLDDLGSRGSEETGPAVDRPLLFDGQRLDQPTFHELYLQTPENFRAELIDGVVYLRNGRVSFTHGRPHASLMGLLAMYSIDTPGTSGLGRSTMLLGPWSEVEPDVSLLIDPDSGGRTRENEQEFLENCPELIVEIASDDTLQRDMNAKKSVYERAGASEYLILDVPNREFRWFARRGVSFELLSADGDGILRSGAFPGLWLDSVAFLRDDHQAVVATLRRGLQSPEHADFVARLAENRANRP